MIATLERISNKLDAPAPVSAPANLTPQQIREINEQLTDEIITKGNPLGVISAISEQSANAKLDQFRKQAEPFMREATEGFIDRFRSRKRDDDPLYKNVVSEFEKQIEDVDLSALITKPKADQTKTLDLYWNAAKGKVLGAKVQTTRDERPPGSAARGGSAVGTGDSTTGTGYRLSDRERLLLVQNLGLEKAKEAIARIESNPKVLAGE
jgi:hypothetical protein